MIEEMTNRQLAAERIVEDLLKEFRSTTSSVIELPRYNKYILDIVCLLLSSKDIVASVEYHLFEKNHCRTITMRII